MHIGIGANIMQPNKQCMSCKHWVPASTDWLLGYTVGGYCKPGYCKKRRNNSAKRKIH